MTKYKNDTIEMKLNMTDVVILNEAVSTLSKYNKEIGFTFIDT